MNETNNGKKVNKPVYDNRITVFYNRAMAPERSVGFSESPLKPRRLMEFFASHGLAGHLETESSFAPFTASDFQIAHHAKYVNDFFAGTKPLCDSNRLGWSPEFAESVRYTNASLHAAIRHSIANPSRITLSPTSGFHHATPSGGAGFCTFSGQVIASLKIYRETGRAGAYVDMDMHYGNSIGDSQEFAPDLRLAVRHNINPAGSHLRYLGGLRLALDKVKQDAISGNIGYLVLCLGADSHVEDELGGVLDTVEWLRAAEMVCETVREIARDTGVPFPLSLCLFGGYRHDDNDSVLSLHAAGILRCLDTLGGTAIGYTPSVTKNRIR